MGETMRAVANSVRGLKSRPEEFTLMQEYVEDFGNKVSSVDKVTQRIIKEKRGTAETVTEIIVTTHCGAGVLTSPLFFQST